MEIFEAVRDRAGQPDSGAIPRLRSADDVTDGSVASRRRRGWRLIRCADKRDRHRENRDGKDPKPQLGAMSVFGVWSAPEARSARSGVGVARFETLTQAPAAASERRSEVAAGDRERAASVGMLRGPTRAKSKVGAGNGIRTRDFDLGKVALYH